MEAPPQAPSGGTVLVERPAEEAVGNRSWVTIVWDDPVNLMSYVTHVFCTYFHYSRDRAERLMMQVQMERDVNAMHGFGLWATVGRGE